MAPRALLVAVALVAACNNATSGQPLAHDGATGDPGAHDATVADYGVGEATIHYLGRFDTRDPSGPRFAWPGSALVATFTGSGITARLAETGSDYFDVVIDEGAPTTLEAKSGTHGYTLATGLRVGRHTLTLTKRTEAAFGVVQLLGLTPEGGSLVPSTAPFSRRIEVVGDSITCGAGVLGTCDAGPTCCWPSASNEDESIAYGALAAAELHAQQTAVAYSGIGLVRNGDRSTNDLMPVRFLRTLPDDPSSVWSFSTAPPDVVLINLGTNDFWTGDPGSSFVTEYESFVSGGIRPHYPGALVLCALSAMLPEPGRSQARSYLQKVVADLTAAGDSRVSYFEFDLQSATDGLGCNRHPDAITQRKDANQLVSALRALTGW